MLLRSETDDTSSMIDRVGSDCPPDQMYRELTQNAIESIQRTGTKGHVDWGHFVVDGVRKLCVMDDGCGMSPEQAINYVRNLACSGGTISNHGGNYGVGAKISAGVKNPAGVEYRTWKDGVGTRLVFCREGNNYGLRELRSGLAGKDAYYEILSVKDKHPLVTSGHGTMVILHGMSHDEDTVSTSRAFLSANCNPETEYDSLRWLIKYLNSRYFELPTDVTVRVWEEKNATQASWRTIQGEKILLEKHSDARGSQKLLNDVTVHWYIHNEDTHNGSTESYAASPFTAAFYDGELYDQTRNKEAYLRIQNFGVVAGSPRVVLLFELHCTSDQITTDTARTHLLKNNRELPYAEWADIFADNLPQEIIDLIESIRTKKLPRSNDERIYDMLDWLSPPRVRASKNGKQKFEPLTRAIGLPDGNHLGGSGSSDLPSRGHKLNGKDGSSDGTQNGRRHRPSIPKIHWVSLADNTRVQGDMEYSAGKYLHGPHEIQMNKDFEVFQRFAEKLQAKHPKASLGLVEHWMHFRIGARVQEAVTIIIAQNGRNGWLGTDHLNRLTENCITACCMSFSEFENSCSRDIGTNLSRRIRTM